MKEDVYKTKMQSLNRRNAQYRYDMYHYLKMIGNGQITVYCTNDILNAVLHEEKVEAYKRRVAYDIYVEPGFHIGMVSETDIVAILETLYKNALEAAAQCEDGYIRLKMFLQNEGRFAVIKLENSYTGNLATEENRVQTCESDEENHGIGIARVRELAMHYQGSLSYVIEGTLLRTILILPV